jgi:hypothetical protein
MFEILKDLGKILAFCLLALLIGMSLRPLKEGDKENGKR